MFEREVGRRELERGRRELKGGRRKLEEESNRSNKTDRAVTICNKELGLSPDCSVEGVAVYSRIDERCIIQMKCVKLSNELVVSIPETQDFSSTQA